MNGIDPITVKQKEQEYQQILDNLTAKGISARNARRLIANHGKKNIKKFKRQMFKHKDDVKPTFVPPTEEELMQPMTIPVEPPAEEII